jgi:GT2 family glycosyltransferase
MTEGDPPVLAATVVISSRERPAMLLDTVRSILAAHRPPAELIVVDQSIAPNDELERLGTVGGCTVHYVHSTTTGLSRGRNLGLDLATHDTVVILDDDMLVRDDSLERLLDERAGRGPRTVTTGRLLAAAPDQPGRTAAPASLVTRAAAETFRGRQPMQVVPGPNIAVPRAVLREIGGYDERLGAGTRFPAAEDHDLSLRLLDAGCEVRHVPDAVVLHRAWRTRQQVVRLRWTYARGVGGFFAKHASLRDRYVLGRAGAELRSRVSRAIKSIVVSPKQAAAELMTIVGILVGAAEWTIRYRVFGRFHTVRT